MDDLMSHVLCAGTQVKHRQNLGARVDGQPQPQDVGVAAEPGAQFVQLQMREVELAEEAFVQGVCVFASTGEPRRDGGLSKAENPLCGGRVQSFGQRVIRTMATWCEGVFSRYKGVLRRALKVVRHAGPRKVWIGSARPCLPSPTSACL